jgi:hypothetical protein
MKNDDDHYAANRRLLSGLFFFLAASCFTALLWLYFSGFIQAFLVPSGETLDKVVVLALIVGSLGFLIIGVILSSRRK